MNERADQFRAVDAACYALSYAEIRSRVADILAGLTKPELRAMADAVGIVLVSGESKARWCEAFARRIVEKKASADRCSIPFAS